MRFTPHNWNDTLSLFVLVGMGLALVFVPLDTEVRTAFLMMMTLVVQFYFRKKPPGQGGDDGFEELGKTK